MNYLILIVSCICLLLGVNLLFKKNKLFIASLWIINASLFAIVAVFKPPFCVSMFYMPLGIYIHIYYFTHLRLNNVCKYFFVLCALEMIFTNALQFMNWPYLSQNITYFKTIIIFVMFIPVFIQIYKFMKKSEQLVKNQFTKLNFEYYRWLKNIVHTSIYCCAFAILLGIIHTWIEPVPCVDEIVLLSMLLSCLFLYYVSIYKFTNPLLHISHDHRNNENIDINYVQNNGIECIIKLQQLIDVEKVYLKEDFSIQKLAKQLNSNPKKLSKLIKQHFHLSFNEYINKKRIQEAKCKLLDPSFSNLTISAIGEESGFNSRSSFYTSFKKEVGFTPTEFQKRSREDKSHFTKLVASIN